jgi:hypothetical protein
MTAPQAIILIWFTGWILMFVVYLVINRHRLCLMNTISRLTILFLFWPMYALLGLSFAFQIDKTPK